MGTNTQLSIVICTHGTCSLRDETIQDSTAQHLQTAVIDKASRTELPMVRYKRLSSLWVSWVFSFTIIYNMSVLVRISIPEQNIMTKKQVGEERAYSAYTCTLLFITKGSQDRSSHKAGTWRQELMQRPWRSAAYWLASPGCSACFLIEPRTTSPGRALPITGLPTLDH